MQTGPRTAFGKIALRLGKRHEQTAFQRGLQDYSRMLVVITGLLAGSIFLLNSLLGRSLLDSLLFSLAIAVGMTPQLLPAIVTVSLATGARRLVKRSVVVKRLVAIEDLGNVEVLFTDKTGTLTEGRIAFERALDLAGAPEREVLTLGLVANEATLEGGRVVGGNDLDRALWRRSSSAAAPRPARRRSVASREAHGVEALSAADEQELELRGFLCFADPPKADATPSLERLDELGVAVKIVTGDNGRVAERVCARKEPPPGAASPRRPPARLPEPPEAILARCKVVPADADATLDGLFAAGNRVVAATSRWPRSGR